MSGWVEAGSTQGCLLPCQSWPRPAAVSYTHNLCRGARRLR
jgi:hypothetical protein